jgi:hypothetical protein
MAERIRSPDCWRGRDEAIDSTQAERIQAQARRVIQQLSQRYEGTGAQADEEARAEGRDKG